MILVHLAMAQFMAKSTRRFAEVVARIPQPLERNVYIRSSMKDFFAHNHYLFNGTQSQLMQKLGSLTLSN